MLGIGESRVPRTGSGAEQGVEAPAARYEHDPSGRAEPKCG